MVVEFYSYKYFPHTYLRRPKAPAFVFLSPLEPKWTHLRSIIPNVLQLSVIGYPFINPGAVGGVPSGNLEPTNSSDDVTQQLQEDLELYVRWWQLNTFLPMLHFVKPPSAFPGAAVRNLSFFFQNQMFSNEICLAQQYRLRRVYQGFIKLTCSMVLLQAQAIF